MFSNPTEGTPESGVIQLWGYLKNKLSDLSENRRLHYSSDNHEKVIPLLERPVDEYSSFLYRERRV